jgi:PGF-pre-PGF domain-containing protein
MTKKRHLALLCAIVIIGLLIPPVMAVEAAPGEDLYSPLDGAQDHPDIDGNMIVWEDNRNDEQKKGNKDIYLGTVDKFRADPGRGTLLPSYTGEQITNNPASQEKPSISGDYIVWQDNRNGNWDIYLYKRSTGREKLITGTGNQRMPIVRGNYAAWYDDSNGKTNVVLYDIAAGSVKKVIDCDATTTIPWGTTEFKPALSEKYVTWVESGEEQIKYYEIETGKIGYASLSDNRQSWPSLSGSLIAWEDYRNGNPDIYMTDLANPSGWERRITTDPSDQVSPAISGSIIAWEEKRDKGPDGTDGRGIYLYDLKSGKEKSVRQPDVNYDEHLYPAVSGNTIVWQRGGSPNSNLYIFTYKPAASVDPVLTNIKVTPSTATLKVDGTEQFEATALDQSGKPMTGVEMITWTSSNTTVGTIGESSGLFTAHAAGTTTITATSGAVSGTATVTVSADEPVLASITVTPTATTLGINETETFTATALDQFGKKMTGVEMITWTSSNTTVGTIGESSGLFTAHVAGTTTITATSGEVSGTATVMVTADEPVLGSITVTPTTATLVVNDTKKFTATLKDQFGSPMTGVTVTWDSSNKTVGTINDAGLFSAFAEGTTTVIASAGGLSAKAAVTVKASAPVDPTDPADPVLKSIKVTPLRATLEVEDAQKFIVTGYDQDGNVMPAGKIVWDSSNKTVGTISAAGVFTALAEGTTTVIATAGDISAEVVVTVYAVEPGLAKIGFFPSAVTLNPGDSLKFEAVPLNCYGDFVPEAAITWTSSDPAVGTIDETGLFVALCAGTTTLTISGDGATGTTTVTVCCDEPVLSRIVVTPPAITLNTGDAETFIATAFDQYGCEITGIEVTWACRESCGGTIDPCSGLFTALDDGTATITASAEGVTGTATITVIDAPSGLIDAVAVSPSEITLDVDNTWQFTATAFDLEGNITSDAPVIWTSCDESVGTIDETGLFTAVCGGTTTITASVDGISETGTATVTVRSACPVPSRIVISPSAFTIAPANSLQLTETVYDQYGCVMPDAVVVWESSDPKIGYIGPCGLFGPNEAGEVTITASVDGISGSACVTVGPPLPYPARVKVDPVTTALAPGETQEFIATVFDDSDNEMDWVRVAWLCSDPEVGTLDRAGLFAAFAEGSAEVKALAGDVEGTAAVTVTAAPAPTPDPTLDPGSSANNDWGDGGGDTGPTFSAETCENLMSGETFTFSDISVSSVSSVAITAADTIPRLMVTVKEAARPTAARPPADDVYEYVDISLHWADQRRIGSAEVVFTISADWLEDHGIAPEDVRLMRYVDGAWQSLETEVVSEENGLYRFRATTPGFSTFAIAAAAAENETTAGETNVTTGGETNVTANVTTVVTTEATTVPATTTPATPLVYAPILAPLTFLLWQRKKN